MNDKKKMNNCVWHKILGFEESDPTPQQCMAAFDSWKETFVEASNLTHCQK